MSVLYYYLCVCDQTNVFLLTSSFCNLQHGTFKVGHHWRRAFCFPSLLSFSNSCLIPSWTREVWRRTKSSRSKDKSIPNSSLSEIPFKFTEGLLFLQNKFDETAWDSRFRSFGNVNIRGEVNPTPHALRLPLSSVFKTTLMYFSQRVVPFQSYIVMQLLESRVKALLPSPDQGPGVTEPSTFGEPFEYQVAEVSRPAVHPSSKIRHSRSGSLSLPTTSPSFGNLILHWL